MDPNEEKFLAAIEPEATAVLPYPDNQQSLASIAVSMKRIADAMAPIKIAKADAFNPVQNRPDVLAEMRKAAGIFNIVNGVCTTCDKLDADCQCLPF